jgi:Tol biopolymer transport system component
MSWAGERLLYDATFNGRVVIAGIGPGNVITAEVVPDAFHVAAAPDGSAIVYVSTTRGREGLFMVDASGQRPVRLFSGFAVEPVVTPDRAVVFVSNRDGVQSPWIMPLDGGDATEIVHEFVAAMDVSPDGRRLGFVSQGGPQSAFVVCDLPRCSNRLELPIPMNFDNGLRWTPDGKELAYVGRPSGSDIWATPLDGGAPHAITNFGPEASLIARFAWSRDGRRLAFIRRDVEFDVVLLSGLRP